MGVLVCSLGVEGGGLWSAQASEQRSGAAMPLGVVTLVRGGLGAAGGGGHASWRCDFGQRWPRGIDYRPPLLGAQRFRRRRLRHFGRWGRGSMAYES